MKYLKDWGYSMTTTEENIVPAAKKKPATKGLPIKKSAKKKVNHFDLDVLSGKTPISEDHKSNVDSVIASLPADKNYSALVVKSNCIEPDPNQPRTRKNITEESIAELAGRIEEIGQLYPILVRKHPNPESQFDYMIADGERRWRAIESSEVLTDISIIEVSEDLTAADLLVYQLSANTDREAMTASDKAIAYKKISVMFKSEGKTQEEAAARIGIPRVVLSKYTKLSNDEFADIQNLSDSGICQDIEALYLLTTLKGLSTKIYAKSMADIQDEVIKGSVRAYVKAQIDKANLENNPIVPPARPTKIKRIKPELVSFIESSNENEKLIQLTTKGKVIEIDLSEIADDLKKLLI